MTRSCERIRVTGSAPSRFSSFRSANVARGTSTATVRHQRIGVFAIGNRGYLGVPIRDVLVTLSISFLTQRGDDISKSTQAPVDILRLFQPILIIPRPTLLESFRTSEIDEVERTFAGLPTP